MKTRLLWFLVPLIVHEKVMELWGLLNLSSRMLTVSSSQSLAKRFLSKRLGEDFKSATGQKLFTSTLTPLPFDSNFIGKLDLRSDCAEKWPLFEFQLLNDAKGGDTRNFVALCSFFWQAIFDGLCSMRLSLAADAFFRNRNNFGKASASWDGRIDRIALCVRRRSMDQSFSEWKVCFGKDKIQRKGGHCHTLIYEQRRTSTNLLQLKTNGGQLQTVAVGNHGEDGTSGNGISAVFWKEADSLRWTFDGAAVDDWTESENNQNVRLSA